MKIIQVHNYYKQPGGEDSVVKAELNLLKEAGHTVIPFYQSNSCILGVWQQFISGFKAIWNIRVYFDFKRLLKKERPDVVHCHNTFPLISPALYWACAAEHIPVVQTLHNFRLSCLNSKFYRVIGKNKSGICEKCHKKKFKYPGIRHRCYRDSIAGSFFVSSMILIHHMLGTWKNKVSAYIVLTDFQKHKMIKEGLPQEKCIVKPNFVEEITEKDIYHVNLDLNLKNKPYCLFIGRLSDEKGVHVALKAWARFEANKDLNSSSFNYKFYIIGDGPQRKYLNTLSCKLGIESSVVFLGHRDKQFINWITRDTSFLIFPSLLYETFGLTALEAGLHGVPSLISEPTTTSGLFRDRQTAVLFPMGDEVDLSNAISHAFANPVFMQSIGNNAKQLVKKEYSPEKNLKSLLQIYKQVIGK